MVFSSEELDNVLIGCASIVNTNSYLVLAFI